ncbi:MAG: hypothetical protein II666_10255 [Butyrivibrio sp.]|nr:hypothetical protein [Butyrivibrio sp.]
MKKRVVIMLFCMCIGAFSAGCSSDVFDQVTEEVTGLIDGSNSDDEEVEDIEVKEESEETSEEDSPKVEGKLEKDAIETITDGIYSSYLIASKKDEAGVPDETGAQQKIVYASELSDDVFCIAGSYGYRQNASQDVISVSEDGIFSFAVDKNTNYELQGGDAGPEVQTADEFKKQLADLADSELYLEITVENGVATNIAISI